MNVKQLLIDSKKKVAVYGDTDKIFYVEYRNPSNDKFGVSNLFFENGKIWHVCFYINNEFEGEFLYYPENEIGWFKIRL